MFKQLNINIMAIESLTAKQINDFDEKMENVMGLIGCVVDSLRSDCFFTGYAYQTLNVALDQLAAAYGVITGDNELFEHLKL